MHFSSLIQGAALAVLAGTSHAAPTRNQTAPSVTVKNGTYSGVYSPEYDQEFFLGMPYAEKAQRFTPPSPLNSSWDGTHDATEYPPHCIGYGSDDIGYPLSEDCLYLNVVRPAASSSPSDAGLPVAVWIHGGGLVMGGSADKRYNLSFIVDESVQRDTPIMAVSLNYRLSAFGFLVGQQAMDEGATNIGFRDQRLALQWVRENIAAFGGDPDKVTIFGESSGAESVTAQVMAYGGRDDKLFRAAIGQSGFGTILHRYPGGFNATSAFQSTYDNLVGNVTSCSSLSPSSADALTCLRNAPFSEINHALNVTSVSSWPPVIDDFLTTYSSSQLSSSSYPQIPILIGCNSDEGTAFWSNTVFNPVGATGGANTDADFRSSVLAVLSSSENYPAGSAQLEAIADQVEALYPNIQSLGQPSLSTWPEIITNETEGVEGFGLQYRREAALYGDVDMQYARRMASKSWSKAGLKSWSYRFDVTVNAIPEYIGATHFQEVAFVFKNLAGDGYADNPFGVEDQAKQERMTKLAGSMAGAWINFFVFEDPNGEGKKGGVLPEWPAYDVQDAGGAGKNMVFATENGGSFVEIDDWRAGGMEWMAEHSLDVFGV